MAQLESIPFWKPGQTVTGHAEADVLANRFVAVSGPRVDGNPQVSHVAGARVAGVASVSKAAGSKVMFWADGVLAVEAGAALTAGQAVESDGQGRAIPHASGEVAGIAWDDVAAGAVGPIKSV